MYVYGSTVPTKKHSDIPEEIQYKLHMFIRSIHTVFLYYLDLKYIDVFIPLFLMECLQFYSR